MKTNLYEQVKKAILEDWDPIGIAIHSSFTDEYDAYIPHICYLLRRTKSKEDIFDELWKIETEYLGMEGDRKRTESFAEKLLAIYIGVESQESK